MKPTSWSPHQKKLLASRMDNVCRLIRLCNQSMPGYVVPGECHNGIISNQANVTFHFIRKTDLALLRNYRSC